MDKYKKIEKYGLILTKYNTTVTEHGTFWGKVTLCD